MTSMEKNQIRKQAIVGALEVLGPHARSIVLAYLFRKKRITVARIEEIEASLEELFGEGANLIIDSIATSEPGSR